MSAALAARSPRRAPDPGFDVDGRRTFGYGGEDRATDLALLPDGRVVTAGWTTVNGDVAVTRLTVTASRDPRSPRPGGASSSPAPTLQVPSRASGVTVAGRSGGRGRPLRVSAACADGW